MKKRNIIIVMWSLGWLLFFLSAGAQQDMTQVPITIITKKGKEIRYHVELAVQQKQRSQGLQNRERLEEYAGMLFLFPKDDVVTMWMKDTKIPLDMLFINDVGEVVNVVANTEPESETHISSGIPVRAVLEINAGHAKDKKIGMGSILVELNELLKKEDVR